MTEIVNLRQVRKRTQRAKDEAMAAANRVKFGQTKSARKLAKAEADKVQTILDGAKLDRPTRDG